MPIYSDREIELCFQSLDLHQAVNCIVYGHSTNRQDIRNFALDSVDFSRVHNILDLGCGFGFSTLGLRGRIRPGTHIVGIDVQQGYQRPFLQACESVGAVGEFHASDAGELSTYPPRCFDLVFSCFSLYFFPDVIRHIARVLTEDGTFVAVAHSRSSLRELIRHIPPTLEFLGLEVPELLSIQRLLGAFSAENGEELLRPHFGQVDPRAFTNTLKFLPSQLSHVDVYLRMKQRLLLKEVYEASPDSVGEALGRIMAALALEAREKGVVEFNKDDKVFLCRRPRVAQQEALRPPSPRFCAACGRPLSERKIEGRSRWLCTECGYIAYENPLPVVAAVAVDDRDRLLLVRRARQPMKGMWCLPCGFAEKDERIEEAALRELREETRLTGRVVRLLDVATARNYFYGNLVMISFQVGGLQGVPVPGDDADQARYVPLQQLPPLAFPCQEEAVRKYRELGIQ
ncbi:MAG: NUDIX domain-containing protein [Deltaproteobacteria bacterium]|nr:NUDIX domain-containing protein [Deltaproteobacteria bacterium]